MIISHRHRFIFLKTNKTAGTSIEIALSRYCGEHDVITPISLEDEAVRTSMGYPGPRNFRDPQSQTPMLSADRSGYGGIRFYNHMPAEEILAQVGSEVWESYFTFCFERNPWDRVVSLYYWIYPSSPRPDLKAFLRSPEIHRLKDKGRHVYTIDGKVAVDRVCRYEALEKELGEVCRQLKLPALGPLPRAKSRFRADRRPYREMMDAEDRDLIAELFGDEIDLMGYVF